ncbi:hypothetical protein NDU88_000524 [Pleurodeles waltl]|uniref:Uncharacterized protein n=1 Tax=Pleurodeles waltl TaxID=8319 RepID=A0AAV7U4H2_PLEWA|nr:hypothetical protein NDU88_000524 [Pleurodeles waltl]
MRPGAGTSTLAAPGRKEGVRPLGHTGKEAGRRRALKGAEEAYRTAARLPLPHLIFCSGQPESEPRGGEGHSSQRREACLEWCMTGVAF